MYTSIKKGYDTMTTGKKLWVIPDGFMSDTQNGRFVSHEAVCVLNLCDCDANIKLTIFFEDKEPLEGFTAVCKSKRTNHIRLDKLVNIKGEKIPKETPYSVLVESDAEIIVQHSRMDVSQPEMTLMSTIAY